jgi:hypothetical protein
MRLYENSEWFHQDRIHHSNGIIQCVISNQEEYNILRPCHTIAYRTSVCQRMKNITYTPVYADIR